MKMRRGIRLRVLILGAFALVVPLAAQFAFAQENEDTSKTNAQAARRIAVVTHPDNPVESITRAELGRLFLKKRTFWSTGVRCVPIDQPGTSEIRERFYQIALDIDQTGLKRYWMQETMTGNARPPVTVDNAAIAKKYIEKLTGAVAYIWADEIDETVKVILIRDVPEFAAPEAAEDTDEDSATSP